MGRVSMAANTHARATMMFVLVLVKIELYLEKSAKESAPGKALTHGGTVTSLARRRILARRSTQHCLQQGVDIVQRRNPGSSEPGSINWLLWQLQLYF